jgi:hypothetical protein
MFPRSRPLPPRERPEATAVMDPFHVVRLAGDVLDRCQRRVQHDRHGHRGRTAEPLYSAWRTLHTGADLHTDGQSDQVEALVAIEEAVQVAANLGASIDLPGTSNGLTRRSTVASNTRAPAPSAFATSPTASPDSSRKPTPSGLLHPRLSLSRVGACLRPLDRRPAPGGRRSRGADDQRYRPVDTSTRAAATACRSFSRRIT